MKAFTLIAFGAALAAAQDLSSLPACGQTCINNMITIATTQLGCAQGNVTCYCTDPDFGYGVTDCANEACPTTADAQEVISFGVTYCKKALATYSKTATAPVSSTAFASGTTVLKTVTGSSSSAASSSSSPLSSGSTIASSSSSGSAVVVIKTALTTKPLTSLLTTKGKTLTTTLGKTTILGNTTEIAATTSALTTKITTGGKTITKTTGHTTVLKPTKKKSAKKTTKKAGAKATGAGSKTSTKGGAAPHNTVAPGLLGAAALAFFAL